MTEEILRIEDLKKCFGDRVVLDDIFLFVNKSEILGIIGSSGSGKTTLLKSMVGFIVPDSGKVLLKHSGGYANLLKYDKYAKSKIGYAPQEPSFYPELTVEENIRYFGMLFDLKGTEIEKRMNDALREMELEEYKDNYAYTLSGGMRKRLGMIISTIHDPILFVLDEPTSDLDPHSRKKVMEYLKRMKQQGKAIILASHHLDDIEALCDKVIFIHEGAIIKSDTPKNLKEQYFVKEIRIECLPGDYEAIVENLDRDALDIQRIYIDKYTRELVIKTKNQEAVLQRLFKIIEELKETIASLNTIDPKLEEVFETILSERSEENQSMVKEI
ncbi:MAG: ABC transporter ATP-binding protein [Candidatus Woesearchaeota archaeon]